MTKRRCTAIVAIAVCAALATAVPAQGQVSDTCTADWERYRDAAYVARDRLEELRATLMERSRLDTVHVHHIDLLVFELRTLVIAEASIISCVYTLQSQVLKALIGE